MLALLETVSAFAGPFTFYILRYMTANSFLGAGTRSQHLPKGSSDVSNAKDARRRNGGMKT
jgi:hypothetical protein